MVNGILVQKQPTPGSLNSPFVSVNTVIQLFCYNGTTKVGYEGLYFCSTWGWFPKQFATCERNLPIECPSEVPSILNGFVGNGARNVGSNRTISCNYGYQRVGKASITCLSTGEWERPDTQCGACMLEINVYF